MMMENHALRVVIVDDEPEAKKSLRHLIETYCPLLVVEGEASSVHESLNVIQVLKPDLVFLDMELGDGDGFDVLDAFPMRPFKAVIVSAHSAYALQAYRYRAVHYLLKPVQRQDLTALCAELMLSSPPMTPSPAKLLRLSFCTSNGMVFLHPDEIQAAVADERFASLLLDTGEKLFVGHTLLQLEAMLPPGLFLRVHQSYLVRRNAVVRVIKTEPLTLVLRNKHRAPVSRRNREWVIRELGT